MSSTYLKHKNYKAIEEFIADNKMIYVINLQKFLGCSYRTALRIFHKIKEKYNVKTSYLDSETFKKYIFEGI